MEMKRKECAVWRRAKDLQYDEYREFLAKILIRLKYNGSAKKLVEVPYPILSE